MIFDVDKNIGTQVLVYYSGKRASGTIKSVSEKDNTVTLSNAGVYHLPNKEAGGHYEELPINLSQVERVEFI